MLTAFQLFESTVTICQQQATLRGIRSVAFQAVLGEERLDVAREIDRWLCVDGQREAKGQNEAGWELGGHAVQTPAAGHLLQRKRSALALGLGLGEDQPAFAFHTRDAHTQAFQLGRRRGKTQAQCRGCFSIAQLKLLHKACILWVAAIKVAEHGARLCWMSQFKPL